MTSSTGTVVFNDAKLQAIDVVATERLGVGTLDPASNLHVVGNVHVTGNVNKLNFTDGYAIERGANVTVFGTTDVIQEITGPHARHVVPLRKYPEVAMTSTNQAGYVISFSSADTNSSRTQYGAFDGIFDNSAGEGWQSLTRYSTNTGLPTGDADNATFTVDGTNYKGQWLKLKLPQKIRVESIIISAARSSTLDDRRPHEGVFLGSNDDTNWEFIKSFDINTIGYNDVQSIQDSRATIRGITNTSRYRYLMLVITKIATTNQYGPVQVNELEYYGYEETSDPDTSVDTTITSQFNLPDTTGVKLYLDGDKGSTATDYSGEGHTLTDNSESFTGNAWSFTSLATSNIVSADLGFEGDQPHSVSMWFNCANVTSNATLFHVGTAAGEGDAKTAISLTETGHLGWIDGGDNQFLSANTWHNLVYATQGVGGLRTCYLDGRKLGDVAVQDTYGEYPPFAMTGYSQYGYTVSASGAPNGNYAPYDAFNNTVAEGNGSWHSGLTYATSGSRESTTSTLSSWTGGGGGHNGEWLKIEVPFKLVLNSITFRQRTGAPGQHPRLFSIVGSNDDSNWYLVHEEVSRTFATANAPDPDSHTMTGPYAGTAWKYFAVVIRTGATDNSYNHVAIGDWQLYGHKENDTTRFPISSTVLKYPHIAMTGPAQRGYAASASREPTSYAAPAWQAFDRGTSKWETVGGAYDQTTGAWNSSVTVSTTVDGTGENGDWVQIELPRKIVVTKMRYQPALAVRAPGNGILAASNDGTTWTALYNISNATYTDSVFVDFTISNTTAYKYYRLIATSLYTDNVYNASRNRFSTTELELHGTEPEDVVARVGEGLDGMVANFRVYDKYLREEQALELWDAQKDQFGRAQSSVSVYRGHVGIGTTTPSAALTVMDEAEETGEFPPRAMTAAETYMDGYGVFSASSSSVYSNSYEPYQAFDLTFGNSAWISEAGTYDDSTDLPTGVDKFLNADGSWLKLTTPTKYTLKKLYLYPRTNRLENVSAPGKGKIYASNDDNIWTLLAEYDNLTYSFSLLFAEIQVNSSVAYNNFVIFVEELNSGASPGATYNYTAISSVRFFGTRERGASTLHDGQLTLTKNLTVPRIGPAFDGWASRTPRRDHLVVEYDTSTPVHNGKAYDSSRNNLHGSFGGNASYDIGENAFAFDGSGDYISTTLNNPSGAWIHSVSCWWKASVDPGTSSHDPIFSLGDYSAQDFTTFYIKSNEILISIYSSGAYFPFSVQVDRWYHSTVVMRGTTSSIDDIDFYLDGVKLVSSGQFGTAAARTLPANALLRLGREVGSGTKYFNGSISNFKIYDIALGPGEVRQLYEMGRNGPGSYVNIVDTAVAIGRHAPEAQLDVSGKIRANGSNTNFTGQHRCVPSEPMEQGLIVSADKNKYASITGGLETGTKAITIDESLPVVSLSNVALDKKCFGVVSSVERANTVTRSETIGGFISEENKILGDNRAVVNSVGEGAIWVCDAGGPLDSGDYITTSNVPGYGVAQSDDLLHNYTVAKITMDCDFTATPVPVQAIKKVETLVDVTEDVWSNLSDYNRHSVTELKYVNASGDALTTAEYVALPASEQSAYTQQNVTTRYRIQRGANLLDARGNLQWEDTDQMEAPYKIRYLDASGVETDQANCVHRAAFVGCTYHCG